MSENIELRLKSDLLRNLWHDFCEKHTELYEVTCDEYMHLLASDIDALENTVQEKQKTIAYINRLEQNRNELTQELAQMLNGDTPQNVSDLLTGLRNNNEVEAADHIEKLNLVLLDIIEKIQEQNKKNQFFLNKAIHSLNELKESFSGKGNYKTYSSTGMANNGKTY